MLLSVAPPERFHSLDGSTFQKVGNILRILNLIFRSCDIFSGFCDTALLIFGVFELISP